ncbi:MAG: hypothetical protein QX190_04950 [Methylococcales bacterium]
MKTKKKVLTVAISAVLMIGLVGISTSGYAERKSSSTSGSDSDKRSDSDSGVEAHQKMTICHVPPGNPANKHTIHISSSAWLAHKNHHLGDYLGSCNREISKSKETVVPAVGSTPLKRTVTPILLSNTAITPEVTHIISGCSATYSTALRKAVRTYYEPVTIPDTALDDPSLAMAVSECLDNGDSSDSGKNKADSSHSKDNATNRKTGGKGQGRDSVTDSVSDSGKHRRMTHHIKGCQNKDTTKKADSFHGHDSSKHHDSGHDGHKADSDGVTLNKNYQQRLKDTVDGYMNVANDSDRSKIVSTSKSDLDKKVTAEGKRGIHVSDSSMDDSGVRAAVKTCAKKPHGDSNKMDSSKTGKRKGDSGHKYRIVEDCGTTNTKAVADAIKAYQEKDNDAPIIITESALGDTTIKTLYDDCLDTSKGKGKDTPTPVTANQTISNATISAATITGATTTGSATVTTGGKAVGTTITPASGNNTVTTNATIVGTGGNQVITGGTTTGGTVALSITSGGTAIPAKTTEGVTTGGTTTGGSITDGTITTGTNAGSPVTGEPRIVAGTVSGGTVTGGTNIGGTVTGGTQSTPTNAIVTTTGGVITGGTTTGGTTTGSGVNAVTTGVTVTGGTVTGGTTSSVSCIALTSGAAAKIPVITNGVASCPVDTASPNGYTLTDTGLTITGGTATGVTQTNVAITGTTVSGATTTPGAGVSGLLNWRETSTSQ